GFGGEFEGLRWLATGKLATMPVFFTLLGIGIVILALGAFRLAKGGRDAKSVTCLVFGLATTALAIGIKAKGFMLPMPCVILAIVAVSSAVFFHRTVWGRHLLALGNNEDAARLSGIATGRLVVLAYVV